jgi:hypothetical protein
MGRKIFINYRREDERAMAARIHDRLVQAFGADDVFMDVDKIGAGQRFDRQLEKALSETGVLLAAVGPRWVEILKVRQAAGERDFVCEEISRALQLGIPVIPLMLERTPLPRKDDVPAAVVDFILHQKHDITHEQFGRDVAGLIAVIKSLRKAAGARRSADMGLGMPARIVLGVLALTSVVAVAAYLTLGPGPQPEIPAPVAAEAPAKEAVEAVAQPAPAPAATPAPAPTPAQIVVGDAANVRANSMWFQEPDKLSQWQQLKRASNAAALASYEQEVLGSREAWQFTNRLAVKVLAYNEADEQVTVELTTPGRLAGTEWFVDLSAIIQ